MMHHWRWDVEFATCDILSHAQDTSNWSFHKRAIRPETEFANIAYSWKAWFMGANVRIRELSGLWVVDVLIGISLILMK